MKGNVSLHGLGIGPFRDAELSFEFQLKCRLFQESNLTPRHMELAWTQCPSLLESGERGSASGLPDASVAPHLLTAAEGVTLSSARIAETVHSPPPGLGFLVGEEETVGSNSRGCRGDSARYICKILSLTPAAR